MNRNEIIQLVSEYVGVPRKIVEDILYHFLRISEQCLSENDEISIHPIGIFKIQRIEGKIKGVFCANQHDTSLENEQSRPMDVLVSQDRESRNAAFKCFFLEHGGKPCRIPKCSPHQQCICMKLREN